MITITICEKCGREIIHSVFGWKHSVETYRHRPKPIDVEPNYKLGYMFETPLLRNFPLSTLVDLD